MFRKGHGFVAHSEDTGQSADVIEAVFDRDEFAQALVSVSAALSDHEMGWIQLHFLGDHRVQMSVVSHNLSIKYDFEGFYEGRGLIKVNGKQLNDYVKQLPSEKLKLTAQLPQQLTLRCGRSSARMQLVQDPALADFSLPPVGTQILAKGDCLERWVNTYKDFVSVDDTRFYANGALVWAEKESGSALNAVASDALRLAKARMTDGLQIEQLDSSAVLVPKRALEELRRVCGQNPGQEFQLRWQQDSQYFSIVTDNYMMISKCIAGKYPPYSSAIPKEINFRVSVETRSLLESVRRVLLFADKNRIIRLNFDGPVLDVQSFTPGQKEGEDIIELKEPVQEPFLVNYNGSLLTGILGALSGSELTFSWENVNRPVQITGEGEKGVDVFYLLVPTRF
jgi:DNA polymerase-3 subunit beta